MSIQRFFARPSPAGGRFLRIGAVVTIVVGGVLISSVPTGADTVGAASSRGIRNPNPGETSAADGSVDLLHAALKATSGKSFNPKSTRAQLMKLTNGAEHGIDKGQDCAALQQLTSLEQTLRALPAPANGAPSSLVESLLAPAVTAQSELMGDGSTAACGGSPVGTPPSNAPVAAVTAADTDHVILHLTFPPPTFGPQQGGGSSYLEMFTPGTGDGPPTYGAPEVPMASESLAVPLGALPAVQVLGTTGYQLSGIQLWPRQQSAAAAAGGPVDPNLPPPPPFTVDPAAYDSSTPFPLQPTAVSPVISEHGLGLTSLRIATGSFTPASHQLEVLTSADVEVTFGGNNQGTFGTTDLTDVWNLPFENIYQSSVVNWPSVISHVSPVAQLALCGEEMMVITDTRLASVAQTFAADRTAHGVLSTVFVTDGVGGIGTTPTAIRNAIAAQYNNPRCKPRPSYVTIIGDVTDVPTFELSLGFTGGNPNFFEDPVATDQPYGYIHQASSIDAGDYTDLSPDLLVGRIPGVNPASITAAINRYEDTPPSSPAFYGHVTGAEFFQPCPVIAANCTDGKGNQLQPSTHDLTSFMRGSEAVGNYASVAGKTFVRVANDEQSNDPSVTINPQTFDNGVALPGGINWNGGTSDITNAENAGSFLLWHSDHGCSSAWCWYEPAFNFNNFSSFTTAQTNGWLPVVWSSDCDSGKFDHPTGMPYVVNGTNPSLSEAALEAGSAVAAVGSSRESAIYWDGILLQEMGASLFPEEGNIFRVAFGLSPVLPVREAGALLQAVKNYAMSTTDMTTDTGAWGMALEYTLFGDPSMEILRDQPLPIFATAYAGHLVTANDVSVQTSQANANGAVVTLLLNGQYIGRGIIVNGAADIPTVTSLTSTSGLQVIVGGDHYTPMTLSPF